MLFLAIQEIFFGVISLFRAYYDDRSKISNAVLAWSTSRLLASGDSHTKRSNGCPRNGERAFKNVRCPPFSIDEAFINDRSMDGHGDNSNERTDRFGGRLGDRAEIFNATPVRYRTPIERDPPFIEGYYGPYSPAPAAVDLRSLKSK